MGVSLPLLDAARPADSPTPPWLKVRAPGGPKYIRLKGLMREWNLHSVCEEAHCPNIGECWEDLTATFMILGDICTRNCGYCAVRHGRPAWEDREEPLRAGRAVAGLGPAHAARRARLGRPRGAPAGGPRGRGARPRARGDHVGESRRSGGRRRGPFCRNR